MSLLETILALALVSLILIFVLSLFPDSLLAVRRSEQDLAADQWAASLIELQAAQPFDQLTPSATPYEPAPLTSGPTTYRAQVTIFTVPGTRQDLLKGVKVQVNWEHRGVSHRIEQQCLVPYAGH